MGSNLTGTRWRWKRPRLIRALDAHFMSSRRRFLRSTVVGGSVALLSQVTPWARGVAAISEAVSQALLEFTPVGADTGNTVILPRGFSWYVVGSWGDPLWTKTSPFDPVTRGNAESQALSLGDNNDGMELFEKNGRVLLAVNNESLNPEVLFGNRRSRLPETADDVHKGMAAVGVSLFEIARQPIRWGIVKDSPANRRVTAVTEMEITGPASGHEDMKTSYDPSGKLARGSWSNCGSGKTPWGTYLTCEENFDLVFGNENRVEPTAAMKRYGVGYSRICGYGWTKVDSRFDVGAEPNEANRVGYVVEINPGDPASVPRKRTALGRLKHENAEVILTEDGRVVVYMGDDEAGEFLYRFISRDSHEPGNHDVLDSGQLSVARFYDNGRGEWLPLEPESTGMPLAEICIFTRIAASKVQATTLDRPEWIAAHPGRAEVYCALTNNPGRGLRPNWGGDATPVGGPNPRRKNQYGQIVRWRPDGSDHTSREFHWDLFVMAGNPARHDDVYGGSSNISVDNMFNSPDGMAFDSRGGLWIQTDGKDSNTGDFEGQGNNQMLMADPGDGTIKRFLAGPQGAEITGLCWSPDKKTMFVGIQHPKGKFPPGGSGDTLPRSSIVAIERDDGGDIG